MRLVRALRPAPVARLLRNKVTRDWKGTRRAMRTSAHQFKWVMLQVAAAFMMPNIERADDACSSAGHQPCMRGPAAGCCGAVRTHSAIPTGASTHARNIDHGWPWCLGRGARDRASASCLRSRDKSTGMRLTATLSTAAKSGADSAFGARFERVAAGLVPALKDRLRLEAFDGWELTPAMHLENGQQN